MICGVCYGRSKGQVAMIRNMNTAFRKMETAGFACLRFGGREGFGNSSIRGGSPAAKLLSIPGATQSPWIPDWLEDFLTVRCRHR